MKLDASGLEPIFAMLADGAFGVSFKETEDGVLIERVDPVLSVAEVAKWLGWSEPVIRTMEKKNLLHALRSKGRSGSLRFRKSRLVADLNRMENFQ